MKRIFLITALSLVSISAYAQQAQPSLTDQLGAMRQAQDENDEVARQAQAAHEAAQRAYQQRMAQERAAAQAQEEQRQAAALALQQQRQAAILAQQQQRAAEAEADKKRDQAYQDQLRALDVQQKQLAVEAEKARVARSNEYIDQELKAKAAETDVVKSEADSNRDISSGTKTLLEKTGDAEVKSQSGWSSWFK
jgi:hypothetical protein